MTDSGEDLQRHLLELFREELAAHLATLNSGLLELERSGAVAPPDDLIREMFRAAHSVKGAAHAVSLPRLAEVADRLETTLSELRKGTIGLDDSVVTSLFDGVDELATRASAADLGPSAAPAAPAAPPAASAPPAPAPAVPLATPTSLRVAPAKLDELMRNTAQLTALSGRLEHVVDALEQSYGSDRDEAVGATVNDAAALMRDIRRLAGDFSGLAQSLRLQAFADVVDGFDRAVRDLARDENKRVRLAIEGADVDVDRDIASALRDPLLHLLRNAVAHGIESPEQRRAAGKPEHGTVTIAAAAHGDRFEVHVRDDGAGIDVEALREAAAQAGVADAADDLTTAFLPGVSTKAAVTSAAGRGVGLDAVRTTIERLGGAVTIESEQGHGTTVVIRAPLTRSTARLLLVTVAGGEVIGIPTGLVRRLVKITPRDVRHVDGRDVVLVDDASVPALSLASALGFAEEPPGDDEAIPLVIVDADGRPVAFVVDGFSDELEVVLEALPPRLAHVPELIGLTTTRDGRPVLVANVPACVRRGRDAGLRTVDVAQPAAPTRVLLAEDTVTTRALERSILEAAGYEVIVAVDGMEAKELLEMHGADVVVSDVDMPRMSGIELCRAIRSSTRFRDLPVVLVTSMESTEDRERGIQAGATRYLVKSAFDQNLLLETVASVL